MKIRLLLNVAAAALIAGAVAFSAPAKADPPDWAGHGGHWSHDQGDDDHDYAQEEHHHHHDEHHDDHHDWHGDHYHHDHGHDHFELAEHDRDEFRVYFAHHKDKWCKRHWRQCRPGEVYAIGAVMPAAVPYEVLPPTVIAVPPPPNAVYVQTGGSVYVMDKTTKTILDAVNLAGDLAH